MTVIWTFWWGLLKALWNMHLLMECVRLFGLTKMIAACSLAGHILMLSISARDWLSALRWTSKTPCALLISRCGVWLKTARETSCFLSGSHSVSTDFALLLYSVLFVKQSWQTESATTTIDFRGPRFDAPLNRLSCCRARLLAGQYRCRKLGPRH